MECLSKLVEGGTLGDLLEFELVKEIPLHFELLGEVGPLLSGLLVQAIVNVEGAETHTNKCHLGRLLNKHSFLY